jgi:hypothetical protein
MSLMSTSRRNLLIPYRRERDWVLGEFKAGRSPILIATDVASRGLGTSILASIPWVVISNNQAGCIAISCS